MTQKLGHARTVPSACPARRGRNWSPEDGAGLGAGGVGGDDPVPRPRTLSGQCDVSVEEDSHQGWTFTLPKHWAAAAGPPEGKQSGGFGPAGGRGREFLGSGCGEATTRGRTQVTRRGRLEPRSVPLYLAAVCAVPGGARHARLCPGQQPLIRALRVPGVPQHAALLPSVTRKARALEGNRRGG